MKYILLIILIIFPFICKAQQDNFLAEANYNDEPKEEEQLRLIVSIPASYPGGYPEMFEFIKKNLLYPQEAYYKRIEGTVFIKTLISESGKLEEISVYSGVGFGCNEEALRIIKKMPVWEPAQHDGVAVKRKLIIPIAFELPKK